MVHKDAKLSGEWIGDADCSSLSGTFIQEDSSRKAMTMHAYDVHYGTVKEGEVLVALDDSIVILMRGVSGVITELEVRSGFYGIRSAAIH